MRPQWSEFESTDVNILYELKGKRFETPTRYLDKPNPKLNKLLYKSNFK